MLRKAKGILNEHRDKLDKCVALLMEKERITREEFEALFETENVDNVVQDDEKMIKICKVCADLY